MNALIEMTRALKFYGFFSIEIDASLDRHYNNHAILVSENIYIKIANNSNGDHHFSLFFRENNVPHCMLTHSNAFQMAKQLYAMTR